MVSSIPKLYVVPTPIGNLEDITLRAMRVLKEVDIILAEDTRKTKKLLAHYNIAPKLVYSHHKHNEHRSAEGCIDLIQKGQSIALVSDAGTPGISDPGFHLIRLCIDNHIEVDCLPGATALVPALVQSGIPCDRFYFEGFLPHKKGRQTKLKYLSELDKTIVLYESPHRLLKTIQQLIVHMGAERWACVCREISKMHQETVRGTLQDIEHHFFKKTSVKGEIVLIVHEKTVETN